MNFFDGLIGAIAISGALITAASMISTSLNNIAQAIREQKDKK